VQHRGGTWVSDETLDSPSPSVITAAAGWYIRLLRDEVLAEWGLEGGAPVLHVYCHVSGQERWLAPPQLRNYIFKREMPLVRCPACASERQLWEVIMESTARFMTGRRGGNCKLVFRGLDPTHADWGDRSAGRSLNPAICRARGELSLLFPDA